MMKKTPFCMLKWVRNGWSVLQGAGGVQVGRAGIEPSAWVHREGHLCVQQRADGRLVLDYSCLLTAALSQGEGILHVIS